MELKPTLQHYTRAEFFTFVYALINFETLASEHDAMVEHFDRIVGMPQGADLLFYPIDILGRPTTPDADTVLRQVKRWHNAHGQLAFSDDVLPPPPLPAGANAAQRARAAAMQNLAGAQHNEAELAQAQHALDVAFAKLEAFIALAQAVAGDVLSLQSCLASFDPAWRGVQAPFNRHVLWAGTLREAAERAERAQRYTSLDASIQAQVLQVARRAQLRQAEQALANQARREHLNDQAVALATALEQRLRAALVASGAGPAHEPAFFEMALPGADSGPRILTPHLPVARKLDSVIAQFRQAIRSAVAGILWQAKRDEHSANQSRVIAFGYDCPGAGEPMALCIPLEALMPVEGYDWLWLARNESQVHLPVRAASGWIGPRPNEPPFARQAQICLIQTGSAMVASQVKVVVAHLDAASGDYHVTSPGRVPHRVRWVSTQLPALPGVMRGGNVSIPNLPLIEPLLPGVEVLCDDCVVAFPPEAGVAPLYLLFKGAHEYAL